MREGPSKGVSRGLKAQPTKVGIEVEVGDAPSRVVVLDPKIEDHE